KHRAKTISLRQNWYSRFSNKNIQAISCIAADDEPLAINLIESYVLQTPFLQLKGKCSSAIEAMQYLSNTDAVQLIHLDIQMPDLAGIDFSRRLSPRIKIICTTAFEQYALEGYKVNAIGYLLKPFDYAEFLAATNKAKRLIEEENNMPSVAAAPAD